MHKWKWIIWNLLGFILCVVGVAIVGKTLIEANFDVDAFQTIVFETNTYNVEESVTGLAINVNMEDVSLILSSDDKVRVTFFEDEKEKHQVRVENGILSISLVDEREWHEKFGFFAQTPSVIIELPKATYDEISIGTNTGEVEISDLTCENLNVKVNTGDVDLTRVIANREMRVKTNSGDADFDECDAGSICVEVVTGSVTGNFLTEKRFKTKTVTGSVRVPDSTTGATCEITTRTGDIRVEIKKK